MVLAFSRIGNSVLVEINGERTSYVAIAKLVYAYGGEEEGPDLCTEMKNFVEKVFRSLTDTTVSIVTIVSSHGCSTYVVASSKDEESLRYRLDVVCGTLETVSEGYVVCQNVSASEALSVIARMFVPPSFSLRRAKSCDAPTELHVASHAPRVLTLPFQSLDYVKQVFDRGIVSIGRLVGYEDIVVKLSEIHLARHIAIVGATGSGKSTTASVIAVEAARKGYAVLIVDWHGEYEDLLKDCDVEVLYADPLKDTVPEPLKLHELLRREPLAFIEVLEAGLDLTPAQVHILEDAVNIVKDRKVHGYVVDYLVDIIQTSTTSARWFTESREALLRKLKPLTSQYLGVNWSKLRFVPIERGKVMIFNVSSIPNVRVRKVLTSLLLRSLALHAQYGDIDRPLLVIVDEAHNVFDEYNPVTKLIAEVRKWGIGFVVISQAPSMLDSIVLKNTNTKIVHALKASQDINAVLASIAVDRRIVKTIASLRPGEALLSIPEVPMPLFVKIDADIVRRRIDE